MIKTSELQRLADALSVPDGGFTVDVITGHTPRTGYMVSIFPDRSKVISDPIETLDLIVYVGQHHEILDEPGSYFGGWHDPHTGKIWLDISVRVSTRERAERLCQTYHQLAYFDLDLQHSVCAAPMVLA